MSLSQRFSLLLLLLSLSFVTEARVISYAPYTDRASLPAIQSRLNRHFVLIEAAPATTQFAVSSPLANAQLVLYDARGEEEPRVIYPQDGTYAQFVTAAVRETSSGVPVIYIQTRNATSSHLISRDGGSTWLPVRDIPGAQGDSVNLPQDFGGLYIRSRSSNVRIGSESTPFIVANRGSVYGVSPDGTTRVLYSIAGGLPGNALGLVGTDRDGNRLLIRYGAEILFVDANGSRSLGTFGQTADGFITNDGDAYVEDSGIGRSTTLYFFRGTTKSTILTTQFGTVGNALVFAIPTSDYSGAWIIQRSRSTPTILYRHTAAAGLEKQWEDVSGPEVEALHTGTSGTKLLIQVHRPKTAFDQQRVFVDPALAVWRVGDPAPRAYDELYLNEQATKGFIHLDVEKIENEHFVFDSGVQFVGPASGVSAGGGGGGDVVQEWGVVRGSLRQGLVLPSVGRTPGAFGSQWVSDIIIYNPLSTTQRVSVRYAATGGAATIAEARTATLILQPKEIRLIEDAAKGLFGVEQGIGAMLFDGEEVIAVTGRTYSQSAAGTYGFGMNAIDRLAAAASSRFPVTFSGAFLGDGYRTNLVMFDTSARGTDASLSASGVYGPMGLANVMFQVTPAGQQQFNNIGGTLGLQFYESGALSVRPAKGTAVASVFVIDNRTNDATYFPPDLTAPLGRTLPVIGHLDGANNSRFRSDLYVYNNSTTPRSVFLQAFPWEGAPQQSAGVNVTLLPNESRIFRDVLSSVFGMTGFAKLRYQSAGDGVRVSSRTYSISDDGGTYGFLMPPLNNFQVACVGDSLEILGAIGDDRFRTNIGLVDAATFVNAQGVNARIDIIDATGTQIDTFLASIAPTGGRQINDIFRSRGLAVSGPVLIRVTVTSGLIGAYATMTDNRTNDSVYLSANLAAQP